jgi:hypothetical protein
MMPPLTPEWIAYNNAPHILGVVGSFFTVAAIVVLLRCYTVIVPDTYMLSHVNG